MDIEYKISASRMLLCFISVLALWCGTVHAQNQPQPQQRAVFTSSPNPVGSGARAIGMGGAFIAVADDATAASWNPAGLTQLRKPEFSFAYSYFRRQEDYRVSGHPEATGSQVVSNDDLNYLSIAYPFKLFERNMIVSLNYQLLYEFNKELNMFVKDTDSLGSLEQTLHYRQEGKLRTLSPAYAVQITPRLSLGVTFNWWTDTLFWRNGWQTDSVLKGYIFYGSRSGTEFNFHYRERYYDFTGFNMNLGFLWHANRMVTIGGVLKTPFTAHVKHKRQDETVYYNPDSTIIKSTYYLRENVRLRMPLSFGFGIALRFSDAFTASLDIYHTQWSKFIIDDSSGARRSPITGKFTRDSHVSGTTQVRLGAEYLFILTNTVIPVRGGLFYDPEPADNHPADFWGITLGTGASIKNAVFDIAYQFRQGNNVGKQALTSIPGSEADVFQHLIIASIIYHF
jgi:long-subunit fatty acid transport protein